MAEREDQQRSSPTQNASPPNSVTTQPPRRQLPQILVAKILTMILQNATALVTHQPRSHNIAQLNILRSELVLYSPFFDPTHKPEELRLRTRRAQISFTDIVVLMARLMKVLISRGMEEEGDEQRRERMEVRNECLDLPFFQRSEVESARPFGDGDQEGFEDEGCVI